MDIISKLRKVDLLPEIKVRDSVIVDFIPFLKIRGSDLNCK